MYILLALVSAILAGISFRFYTTTVPENKLYIVGAIVFAVLTIVFGGLFLSNRVNKTDDIHITE